MPIFSSESKSQQQVDPFRRDQMVDFTNRLYGLSKTPLEMFPGQTYAGMDPLQQEALGMREEYARGLGGMYDPTMAAWQQTLGAPDVAGNPYVQQMLEQQANLLNQNLQENIMPGIRSGAISAGQLGSSRQGVAEGLAAGRTQDALARSAAATQLDAYGKGLAQRQFGLGYAPQIMSMGMLPADILSGVGGAQRAEEQLGIDEAMRRHEFEQTEPLQRMQNILPLYHNISAPYRTSTTTQQTTPSALQVGGQLAGMGLAGAGMFQGYGLGGGGGGGMSPFGYRPAYNALMGGYGTNPGSQQSQMLANQMLWG